MKAPPLLVSFSSLENLLIALPQVAREAVRSEVTELLRRNLPPAANFQVLSTLFGVRPSFIFHLVRKPEKNYRAFKIKTGKKSRQIHSPRVGLKLIQKWYAEHISAAKSFPPQVHGFIPGKNGVIESAKTHCNSKWVLSIDLRDFFGQVTRERLLPQLAEIGFSEKASELILSLCLFKNKLPQGSPASPVLSNIAFEPTDKLIIEAIIERSIRYTRYADDLVFSGTTDEPPEGLLEEIIRILHTNGWVIADEKTKLAKLPHRLKVHGLLVHNDTPRLTKGYRNRIRAYEHLLTSGKIRGDDLAKVKGHLAYAQLVAQPQ